LDWTGIRAWFGEMGWPTDSFPFAKLVGEHALDFGGIDLASYLGILEVTPVLRQGFDKVHHNAVTAARLAARDPDVHDYATVANAMYRLNGDYPPTAALVAFAEDAPVKPMGSEWLIRAAVDDRWDEDQIA